MLTDPDASLITTSQSTDRSTLRQEDKEDKDAQMQTTDVRAQESTIENDSMDDAEKVTLQLDRMLGEMVGNGAIGKSQEEFQDEIARLEDKARSCFGDQPNAVRSPTRSTKQHMPLKSKGITKDIVAPYIPEAKKSAQKKKGAKKSLPSPEERNITCSRNNAQNHCLAIPQMRKWKREHTMED